uniref:Putative secreted protein n=1 Tax=Anopheles darlingi TaxID=43151 RepID=A0A2M4D082_ANODA
MKGYNTSLGVRWSTIPLLLLLLLLVGTVVLGGAEGREAKGGYEAYRQRHQRQQMERQMQLRQHEEKNSEFVKGKSKSQEHCCNQTAPSKSDRGRRTRVEGARASFEVVN